jgi:hypothetical protein
LSLPIGLSGFAGDFILGGVGPRDMFASGVTGNLWHLDGSTWGPMLWPNASPIFDMSVDRVGDVFAVGQDGAFVWNGFGIESQDIASTLKVSGVWGTGPDDVYASVSDGVHRFDGTAWSLLHAFTPPACSTCSTAVSGSSTNDVFVAETDANTNTSALRFDGTTWTPAFFYYAYTGSFATGYAISAGGPGDVFIVYNLDDPISGQALGDIIHDDGAGNFKDAASFNPNFSGMPGLTGVFAVSPSKAFVVGRLAVFGTNTGGYIGFYDATTVTAGGGVVTDIAMLPTPLFAIWGSGPTDIFAVGDAGTILHYDGTAWTSMVSNTTETLHAVGGTGPTDVFVVGDGSTILHYNGVNWMPVRAKDTTTIRGLWSSPGATFFVGDNGSIQRLIRTCTNTEVHCGDGWDNDCDGLVDCADPDCTGDPFCTAGGLCQPAIDIACNTTTHGSNLLRAAHIDNYACSPRPESGREVVYRLAPATTAVTVTLSGMAADLDLIVVGAAASGGCDPLGACVGASATNSPTEQVSFTAAAGASYFVVVDGYQDATSDFTVQVDCQ